MPHERVVYQFSHRCTQCGGRAEQHFAEELRPTGLIWWESWRCHDCGDASEADGRDRIADDLRALVIGAEGTFRVDVLPVNKLALLQILRDTFGMSLPDAAQAYGLLPYGFRSGLTRTEAEWVASQFSAQVAEVSIVREHT